MVEKVTLSADTLFDFDRATIRSDAKTRLDELVAKVKTVELETVIDIGYTDRIGGNAYPQVLHLLPVHLVKEHGAGHALQSRLADLPKFKELPDT